jgi:hypothetical protein
MKKNWIKIVIFICVLIIAGIVGYFSKEIFSKKLDYKLMTTNEAIEFKVIDYKNIFYNYKDFSSFISDHKISTDLSKYYKKFFNNYNLIVISYDTNSFCGNIKLKNVSHLFKTAFIDYTISTKNVYDKNNLCTLDTSKNRIDYYSVDKSITKFYTTIKKKN